jgi:sec-independent protein translocase protein TatA
MLDTIILGGIGWTEILLILLALVLLFGGKKIPDLMRGIGEGIREFKKASKGESEEKDKTSNTEKK